MPSPIPLFAGHAAVLPGDTLPEGTNRGILMHHLKLVNDLACILSATLANPHLNS
jgi:hypothetical protein